MMSFLSDSRLSAWFEEKMDLYFIQLYFQKESGKCNIRFLNYLNDVFSKCESSHQKYLHRFYRWKKKYFHDFDFYSMHFINWHMKVKKKQNNINIKQVILLNYVYMSADNILINIVLHIQYNILLTMQYIFSWNYF